jgi:hypothetical protein
MGLMRIMTACVEQNIYDTSGGALIDKHTGVPIIFPMPLLTPEGCFSRDRTTTKPLIQRFEKMIFGVAVRQNFSGPRDTNYRHNFVVHGIFFTRPPRRQGPEISVARKMLGGPGWRAWPWFRQPSAEPFKSRCDPASKHRTVE